jgi:vacuolar-type H+-ATPase subunit H
MDIQHLVDRLEDLIDEGRHMPMTKFTLVDEERALEIIDQMRISVPEEIEKANRLLGQRDRLIAQANEEAARILELSREKHETLVQRDSVVSAAQNRAHNIIEQAKQDAEAIRADADTYVLSVLTDLEGQLIKTLTQVRNGINKLMQDRDAAKTRVDALVSAPLIPITAEVETDVMAEVSASPTD